MVYALATLGIRLNVSYILNDILKTLNNKSQQLKQLRKLNKHTIQKDKQ